MSEFRFSSLFKLPAGQITAAFTAAQRIGGLDGIRLLHAPASKATFIIALTRAVGGGVSRNRLRRRIKGALQVVIREKGPLPNGVVLCVTYPGAANRSHQELVACLSRIYSGK